MKKTDNQIIRAGGVAQVIDCLPGKCEVLSSNSSTAKQEEEEEER
jgi:hypothetical protein